MQTFSKWWVWLKVDEDMDLQWICLRSSTFFIHWNLSDPTMDEEGMIHVVATHPTEPNIHPKVEMIVDSLTGLLVAYQYRNSRCVLQLYTLAGVSYVKQGEGVGI